MKTLTDLRRWAASAPSGTMLSVESLLEVLGGLEPEREPEPAPTAPPTWRVLLWTVEPETRIGRDELLEAVGRPQSWLYRHTGPAAPRTSAESPVERLRGSSPMDGAPPRAPDKVVKRPQSSDTAV